MAATLSPLCRAKRESHFLRLSQAFLLPALCSTHGSLCFPEDPSCSPCLQHSDGHKKPPARTTLCLAKAPGLKPKGTALVGQASSWSLPACPIAAPGHPVPRLPKALHPSPSPFPRSDVTFVVGREQQKVFAHRCVLACRCQAFRGMLSQELVGSEDPPGSIPPQGPFILGNVQPEVFLAVIEFLYTNSVTLNSHIVSGAGAGRDHGHGRDKVGMDAGVEGAWQVEGMLCMMLSGWLTVQ